MIVLIMLATMLVDKSSSPDAWGRLSAEQRELVMYYAEHVDHERWAGSYVSAFQLVSIDKGRMKQVSPGYFDVWLRHDYARKNKKIRLSYTHEEFDCREQTKVHFIEGVNYGPRGSVISRSEEQFITITPESEGEALYQQVCRDLVKLTSATEPKQ